MAKKSPVKRKKKLSLKQAYDGVRTQTRRAARRRAPRNDVFVNPDTGQNSHNSKTACTDWETQVGRDRRTLNNLFRFVPLYRRITVREPVDAVRPRFKVKALDEQRNKDLWKFLDARNFTNSLAMGGAWARLHGGGAIYMSINDQFEAGAKDDKGKPRTIDKSQPVDINKIMNFGALTVLDRWELAAIEFDMDIDSGQLYAPTMYQLNITSEKIHPSRLLIFHGITLSPYAAFQNQGWGGSVIDAVFSSVMQYTSCKDFLLEAINRNTQGVLKFADWKDSMTTEGGEDAQARIDFLGEHMSALGDVALDTDEDYEVHVRGLAGFGEAAAVFVDAMVADTEQPKSILMGQTPGGLNSGGNEGDWKAWTSYLAGVQGEKYTPPVLKALEYVVRARNSPLGDMPESLEIEWGSLFELSELDTATEFSTTMTGLGTAILNRIIDPDEARSNTVLQKNVDLGELDEPEEGNEPIEGTPEEQEEIIAGEEVEEEEEDQPAIARADSAGVLLLEVLKGLDGATAKHG